MAIKIYRVKSDPLSFSLLPSDRDIWRRLKLFQLVRMMSDWGDSLPFYVRDPARTKIMDFFNLHLGALAFSQEIYENSLGEILERSGEILKVRVDGMRENVYALNVLACYNCLDEGESKIRYATDGVSVVGIEEYSFHSDRIGEQNIFKIPQTKNNAVYVVSGRDDFKDSFYDVYHEATKTGLVFEEVWCSR